MIKGDPQLSLIPHYSDGVMKYRVRSRCFSQPFLNLRALLIAEMIDKWEESFEAFTKSMMNLQKEGIETWTLRCYSTKKTLKKEQDPGKLLIPCCIHNHNLPNALCDTGSAVSIMAIDTADLLGLKMEPSQDSFNFVDNSRENSAGMIKNVKVEIGDCTIHVDFHALNFKSGKTPPLLFGRAFMATVGAVCDLKKNKMCLTNVDETVFYDPVEKKKNSTQESTDESSSYPTSDVDIDITMEDFLELEEFLDLEDGEQLNDLDSDREVTMEYFLELEEWLDSDQKLDNEQNLTRDLKTLLKASIDRHQPNDIDRYPTSTIDRYPTSTIDRYQPNIVARHPPNCIDRHSCLDELPGYTVEMEPIKERMHKYEISHLDFVVPCVVFEVEFPIPPDRDGVRKSRVRSRCFSQPFAKLKALLIAEMIDKEEESMEEAFTQE
ncbi:hypothetical protein F2Q68_00039117 [Brassica cretica]|uniref:Aspartic peptidase DDI1-type domain-containing protein n=1 Tax=Brassica cretica TaxID=69181 RepID=A0A8S9MP47_BRACR|nr:hypothetical protein F2Q68_00039117 [Brassica cretica]